MILPEDLWWLARSLHARGFRRAARVTKIVNYFLWRCLLPPEAKVGKNVRLRHYGLGVVIHPNVSIGNDVQIFHGVTIAGESWIGSPHRVVIEDGVTIGVSALIIPRTHSGLVIGKEAIVGAGAVVTRSVSNGDHVVGVPARSIRKQKECLAVELVDHTNANSDLEHRV